MPITGGSPFLSPQDILMRLNQFGYISAGPITTAITGMGLMSSINISDATSDRVATADGLFAFEQNTSAITNNAAGWLIDNAAQHISAVGALPIMAFTLSLQSLTTTRFFVGLADVTTIGAAVAADDIGQEAVGFQFSSARGDTSVQAITNDASTQTTTPIGGSFAINTLYHFIIQVVSTSSITFAVYNNAGTQIGSTITITTTIPTASLQMSLVCASGNLASAVTGTRTFKAFLLHPQSGMSNLNLV